MNIKYASCRSRLHKKIHLVQVLKITCFWLGVAGCSQTASFSAKDKSVVIDSIEIMLNNYHNDIRRSGITAEFNYLDHSDDFFWVPPAAAGYLSYDSVAAVLRRSAPQYKLVDNKFLSLRIIPLSPEMATYTGTIQSTMTDTSGHIQSHFFLESGVLIKRQTRWKLLCGQTSLLPP